MSEETKSESEIGEEWKVLIPVTQHKIDIPCPCGRTWFGVRKGFNDLTLLLSPCVLCGRVAHVRREGSRDVFDGRALDLVRVRYGSGKVGDMFAERPTPEAPSALDPFAQAFEALEHRSRSPDVTVEFDPTQNTIALRCLCGAWRHFAKPDGKSDRLESACVHCGRRAVLRSLPTTGVLHELDVWFGPAWAREAPDGAREEAPAQAPVALTLEQKVGMLASRVEWLEKNGDASGANAASIVGLGEAISQLEQRLERLEKRDIGAQLASLHEAVTQLEKAAAQHAAAIGNLRANESKLTRSIAAFAAPSVPDATARRIDALAIELKQTRATLAALTLEHRKRVALRRKIGAPIERVNRWIAQAREIVAEVLGSRVCAEHHPSARNANAGPARGGRRVRTECN